jgi:hypothetical protein
MHIYRQVADQDMSDVQNSPDTRLKSLKPNDPPAERHDRDRGSSASRTSDLRTDISRWDGTIAINLLG